MKIHLVIQCLAIFSIGIIGCYSYRYINPHQCRYTPTTVSGTKAPQERICKGQLLLDERFIEFDRDFWKHELTLGGGGVSRFILVKNQEIVFKPDCVFYCYSSLNDKAMCNQIAIPFWTQFSEQQLTPDINKTLELHWRWISIAMLS